MRKEEMEEEEEGENEGERDLSLPHWLFLLPWFFLSPSALLQRNIWQSCHVFMRSILIPFRDPESVIHLLPFYFFLCSFRSRSNQMNNRKERGKGIERKKGRERKKCWSNEKKKNASTQNSLTRTRTDLAPVVLLRSENDSRSQPVFSSFLPFSILWFIN